MHISFDLMVGWKYDTRLHPARGPSGVLGGLDAGRRQYQGAPIPLPAPLSLGAIHTETI